MKAYVYFAAISLLVLAGCAYGKLEGSDDLFPQDAATTDAAKPTKDASAPLDAAQPNDDASVDPQDVTTVQPTCDPLPLATGLQACDTCIASSCCAADQACGDDQDCMGFISCSDACFPEDGGEPDQECYATCEETYPNGESELEALDECMETDCSNACD